MRKGADYAKVVEWSTEDRCFVGSCPSLFYGGCHGKDEKKVFAELCDLVDETIETYKKEGRPLPPPTPLTDTSKRKPTIAFAVSRGRRTITADTVKQIEAEDDEA